MADPFEALRLLASPAADPDPDPAFAARLRVRVGRAMSMPRGVTVSTPPQPEPPVAATIAYLAVADARAALEWYAEVFGAEVVGEPIVMPDGRIGHAELDLAGGTLYLADAHPEIGVSAPRPGEATVSLMLQVEDTDETRRRAIAAGARGDRDPYDDYGYRNAWIVDPFGHRWGLQSPLR